MGYDFRKCAKKLLMESFFGSFSGNLETLAEYRFQDKELAEMTTKEGIGAMENLAGRKEEE